MPIFAINPGIDQLDIIGKRRPPGILPGGET